jgi:hypothetical protein
MYKRETPEDLVASMESFVGKLSGYADILRDPMSLYAKEFSDTTVALAMESVNNSEALQKFGDNAYEDHATVFLESMTEDEDEALEAVGMSDLHRGNLQRLLENSATDMRVANANQRGISELTPYDAFLPFAIIRSYLPLIAKDLVPYIVPKQHFIRIKQQYKYIVTKDGQRHLEPDVYNNYEETASILASAKGKRVTDTWYPESAVQTNDDLSAATFTEIVDGAEVGYDFTSDKFMVEDLDLLGESGGVREIGDALDINISIEGARAEVTNAAGETYMVELSGLQHYLDTTAISPKNQLGGKVRFPVKDANGNLERYAEDTIMATYDPYTSRVNVVSMHGIVKQVRFGGNLSNKNNSEYISFNDEYESWQHPIPEGYRANMPITVEDMRLYNETASIDIIAFGINRMTEIYSNLEDTSVVQTVRDETEKWRNVTTHPFEHFKGRVFVTRSVNIKYEQTNPFMKRAVFAQDKISNELNGIIREMRNTCRNEPFRLVAYCHPNIASLFVGDNVDWTVKNGDTIMGGIRSDYNMGITTQDGNAMRIITSIKFREEDGLRGLGFPVNEQNFLSWKHFKRAMYFDRDHRVREMPNNPNIMCVATFFTMSYVPLSFQLKITGYGYEGEATSATVTDADATDASAADTAQVTA